MEEKLNKLFSQLKIRKNQNIILHSNIAGILQFKNLIRIPLAHICLIILKNLPVRAYY